MLCQCTLLVVVSRSTNGRKMLLLLFLYIDFRIFKTSLFIGVLTERKEREEFFPPAERDRSVGIEFDKCEITDNRCDTDGSTAIKLDELLSIKNIKCHCYLVGKKRKVFFLSVKSMRTVSLLQRTTFVLNTFTDPCLNLKTK
jgi:hypothetical protein